MISPAGPAVFAPLRDQMGWMDLRPLFQREKKEKQIGFYKILHQIYTKNHSYHRQVGIWFVMASIVGEIGWQL